MNPLRIMYDSTSAADIPANAQIVAGYVDGRYADYSAMVQRFPDAQHVGITVAGAADARAADCETGDLTPDQAAAWAAGRHDVGVRPTIYCDKGSWPSVQAAVRNRGLAVTDVDWWIADWTGASHLLPGTVATQYANPTTSGGHYDLSVTDGIWPGQAPPPPITPPVSVGGGKMIYTIPITTDAQGNGWDNQYEARNIPWDKRQGAPAHHGSDPAATADATYWPGQAHWQERDGKVLVSVTGCRANSNELVDVTTTE